ncbi:MAG: hypothetical protein P9L94_12405 [Candidatus Hinthialibacter antarcticus]|nr:hypothetical protein [Candidatus Hinthialibacter antarcticus]
MKTLLAAVVLLLCFVVFTMNDAPIVSFNDAVAQDSKPEDSVPEELLIRIYTAPSTFQPGYVEILSQFISFNHTIRYPDSAINDELIASASITKETTSEQPSPTSPVQYDVENNFIVVLATDAEHKQIQNFLSKLQNPIKEDAPVLYRLAFVERDIHPKLKNYPFEFSIWGKCWDEGRTRNKYPRWLINHRENFENLLFREVETDREDKITKFEVHGFARTRQEAERITEYVRTSKNTDSDSKIKEHHFMKESIENLNSELSQIFPKTKLDSIIRSLQKTEVYQVETEAMLAAESSIPGFFRTILGDNYAVEVQCKSGVAEDETFRVEIHVYNNGDEGSEKFDKKYLHLSTSLLTTFGQINMIGVRHNDDRYILLFSMEKV